MNAFVCFNKYEVCSCPNGLVVVNIVVEEDGGEVGEWGIGKKIIIMI
jgi:hypothetical protein